MKFMHKMLLACVSCIASVSVAMAGTTHGKIADINVLKNGDVLFTTSQSGQQNQWLLSHDNKNADAIYNSLFVAAIEGTEIAVEGNGRFSNNGEEIVSFVGGSKTYADLTETQVDCLLNETKEQLTNSGLFKNIVVPTEHTGNVTFTMKVGRDKNFNLAYAHDEATLDLLITIVQTPVGDDPIWQIIDDSLDLCPASK